jgi:mannose-6-phosphate isomerase-like protein (cupin superfamily)
MAKQAVQELVCHWEAMMIVRKNELLAIDRENIRGGRGKAKQYQYLNEGVQHHIKFISEVVLEPMTEIGEHLHENDEEFYLVLWGDGTGVLDGKTFELKQGDSFICKMSHTHGITAGKEGLSFLAILT